MTVIRFARHGTKKKPFFRIVVQDSQSPRNGKFIEHIGHFDPIKGDNSLKVERDRLEYWTSVGAQVSNSVKNRLREIQKTWNSPAGAAPTEAPKAQAKKEQAKEA